MPRKGTRGVILVRSSSFIFEINSYRTPEWPRMSEFILMRIAPRIQDSGITELKGSQSGRTSGGCCDEGRTPECWCCRRACPSSIGWSVRVSALPPKPVETPYTLNPESTLSVITWRLVAILSWVPNELSNDTDTPYRAAAVTAGMERLWPSIIIGLPCLEGYVDKNKTVSDVESVLTCMLQAP